MEHFLCWPRKAIKALTSLRATFVTSSVTTWGVNNSPRFPHLCFFLVKPLFVKRKKSFSSYSCLELIIMIHSML